MYPTDQLAEPPTNQLTGLLIPESGEVGTPSIDPLSSLPPSVNKLTGKRLCPYCVQERSPKLFREGREICQFCEDFDKAARIGTGESVESITLATQASGSESRVFPVPYPLPQDLDPATAPPDFRIPPSETKRRMRVAIANHQRRLRYEELKAEIGPKKLCPTCDNGKDGKGKMWSLRRFRLVGNELSNQCKNCLMISNPRLSRTYRRIYGY